MVLTDTVPGAVFSFYLVPRSKLVPNHIYAFFINQLVRSSRTCLGVLALLSECVARAKDNMPNSELSSSSLLPHQGTSSQGCVGKGVPAYRDSWLTSSPKGYRVLQVSVATQSQYLPEAHRDWPCRPASLSVLGHPRYYQSPFRAALQHLSPAPGCTHCVFHACL